MGEYGLLIEYYTKSLNMYRAVYGEKSSHRDFAMIYNNIGNSYSDMSEYTLSTKYFSRSMNMFRAFRGDNVNHRYIAMIYNNIGMAHENMGEYALSLEHVMKSFNMLFTAVFGCSSPHLLSKELSNPLSVLEFE